MKHFFDTEFIEDGSTIDLISIGIVSEDGREYYAISSEYDASKANDWVKENVISNLANEGKTDRYIKTREQIKNDILEFVGRRPRFYANCCAYDWVVVAQLFGKMIDLPKDWPYYCRDIKQLEEMTHIEVPEQDSVEHNALNDARWTKYAWEYIKENMNSATINI